MASLGQELKEKREARRISIEEIASATKIVPRYLEALEADNFGIMPGRFFIKGIIRTYARAVGLDEDEVLAKYTAAGIVEEPQTKRHSPPRSEPAPPAAKAAAEPPPPPQRAAAPEPIRPPLIASEEPEEPRIPEREPDPEERLLVKPAPEEPAPSSLKNAWTALMRKRNVLLAAGGAVLVLVLAVLVLPGIFRKPGGSQAGSAAPAAVVTPSVLPPPAKTDPEPQPPAEEIWKGVTIEIAFQAETWIQVYADGALTIDGLFPPGATAKAQAAEGLLIHVGNAGGFTFLLNGKPAKPLGRSGQVITDIKITPGNLKDYLETGTPGQPAG
jgi:transcriptional regulator with XRE-family HTH domain